MHSGLIAQLIQPYEHLKKGAEIEAISMDKLKTALIMASYSGHTEAVELLLSKGASVHVKNERGDSALSLATYMGREEVVTRLLDR